MEDRYLDGEGITQFFNLPRHAIVRRDINGDLSPYFIEFA
jgi:hypothetical protein